MRDTIQKSVITTHVTGTVMDANHNFKPVEVDFIGKVSETAAIRKIRRTDNTFNLTSITTEKALYKMPISEFVEHAERNENKE